ncbi:MAG: SGNH/GDSL hydrolase family protein [Ruminococcaceae bacterium]|nr:SGNH/GDSL hydrolase family protein [Oscillospiraceae bacterium]
MLKFEFSQLRLSARKGIALLVALLILISAFSGVLVFNNSIQTQAATIFDSQNPTSYKELINEDFTDGSFNETAWKVAYKSAHLTNGSGLKLDNPTLTYTGSSSYLSNFMAVSNDKASIDQHISVEYNVSANPSSWNNNRYNYLWGRVSLGDKYNGNDRGLHNSSITGYFVRFSSVSNDPIVLIRKSATENATTLMRISGYTNPITPSLPGVFRIDMTITGSSPTVINVRVHKRMGTQNEGYTWSVVASNTYVDESGLQNTSGTAGVAMDPNGNANTYVKNFRYITTDVAEGEEETYNYVQRTDVDTTGRLFAQVVTLDPSKTYKLTALTANTDVSILERFWVEYYSKAGNNQSGNKHRVFIDYPTVSVESGYFTASSATFCINEYVSKSGASPAEQIDSVQWANGGNRTRAIVGFRIDTSKNKLATLTDFALYEVDPETGARKGGNLIVNGDFKLGLYAWNDNQERVYINYQANEVGDSVTGKNLVTCYTCSDKDEFNSMFGKVAVDLNNTYYKLTVDKKLNITYMGGSVTSGHGASNTETTSWRALTTKWFAENYPQATVNSKNAAVGSTGTHFALYNYGRIENYKTDLLFIDAPINDHYLYDNAISGKANPEKVDSYNNTLRQLESLILTARKSNPNIDIVLVLTFDHWSLSETTLPGSKAVLELAKKYQLPLVDLREPLKARAAADGLAWNSEGLKPYRTDNSSDAYEQLYKTGDGVHPLDAGYKIFADYIAEQLDDIIKEAKKVPPTGLVKKQNPATTLSSTVISNPTIITADKIPLSNGWSLASGSFSTISSKFGSTYTSGRVESTTPGSTLTYTFTGTDFGVIFMTGSSCGKVYVEIDGVPYKKGANGDFGDGIIDLYRTGNDHRTQVIMSNAADTQHTITIKSVDGKTVIGGYYVNDTANLKTPLDYKTDFASGNDSGWILSSSADITTGSLNITGSSSTDSHLKNTAFYAVNKTEQRVTVEFEVTASNKHKKPIVWARADWDDKNDPNTITGYYAVYKNSGTVQLYKRYKDGDNYKEQLIGNCGFVHADNRLYRFEILVEGTEQTKISVVTYKYSTDKKKCYFLYKNTFYDNTADLQDAGMAGVANVIVGSSDDTVSNITLFEYTSTDGVKAKTSYLQKNAGVNSYITYGQVVALDPNKTYVFEGKTTETNLGLWVQYNTNSNSNGVQRIFANGGTLSTADNWRRVSCEFNINEWAAANSGKAAFVDSNFTNGSTSQVLAVVGFRMAQITQMGYAEMTLYEKNDADKKNLLINGDLKLGLYGWSDEANETFLAIRSSFEGDTNSPSSRVSLVNPSVDTYKSLFAVGDVDFGEEEDPDNGNQGGGEGGSGDGGEGEGGDDVVSDRPVLENTNANLDYSLSSDFVNGYNGKWQTNGAATPNADNITVNGTSKHYESLSLYGEAHTNQVVALDYSATSGVSPVVWARAVLADKNDLSTVSGYYVFANGATPTLYKRTSDGTDTLIGTCGTHTDNRTFRMEIAVEGTAPTKITVTTYKYPAGKKDGTYALMLKNTFFDYTEELQTPGYAGFSARNTTPVKVTRFEYASSDGVRDNYSYIEKPVSTNIAAMAGQQVTVDPNKTYTLSARVSQANARLSVKYWSASGSMITISSSTGTVSDVDGYRTVSYTFCINDWAKKNNQPLAKKGDGYGELAQVFVGFTTEGADVYCYSNLKLTEEGSSLNLLTNAELKMGMYGWSEAITSNKWAYYAGLYGSSVGAQNKLNLKSNLSKSQYDKIFKASSSDGTDIDYSKIDKFMLHLTGKAGYEYGKVGQMIELEVGKTYVYSVDFGYDPRNKAEPIAFYHTVPDEQISPSTDKRKEFSWLMIRDGSRCTYTFTVPEEAYVNPQTGMATVFVGFSTGEPGNNCYFYDFDLYEKNDANKNNLFVNADFKQGFYGWMINSNYFYNSIKSSIVVAVDEFVRPGNDVELLPYDAKKLKLDDNTLIVPDIPSDVDYSTYKGKYMLHIPETVTSTYGKIGQIISLETKTEYEFTMRFKYIRQNSVKPTILYYTDNPFITDEEITAKGYKDRQAYFIAIRKVASFEETMDDPNCRTTLTFKVPSEAWLDSTGKSPVFIGISTGEFEPICYFTDLCFRKVGTETNLFENADFKDGFYKWIVTFGFGITPVNEKGIFWTSGYTIAQLLPLDETIFVNDTNDALWDDGDWFLSFGEDDEVMADKNDNNTVTDTVKKVVVKGKVNVPLTLALYGGIVVVAAGIVFVIVILVRKKRKQTN